MKPVTDPGTLALLDAGNGPPQRSSLRPVTDPDVLNELERGTSPPAATTMPPTRYTIGPPGMFELGPRPKPPEEDFAGKRPLYDPMVAGDKFADFLAKIPLLGRALPEGGAAKDVVRTVGSTASSFTSTPRDLLLTAAPVPGLKAISQPLKAMFPKT